MSLPPLADILHLRWKKPQPQENAMKISNEQLRIMQENELRKAQQQGRPSGEFGDIFARQLGQGQAQSAVLPTGVPLVSAQAALQLSGVEPAAAIRGTLSSNEAATRMDGMFTSFERYAEQIAQGETGSLREAYNLLQDVGGQIAGFKAEFPNAGTDMPELAALLNELDVLMTTETFKFNRGDYL
jgi:hypothetical protein